MSKNNIGLINYAKEQLGRPYWYGTFGQIATSQLYKSKRAQYPKYYTAGDFNLQYGQRVHDCVGLIKGYIWSKDGTTNPLYNPSQDKSASGMYLASKTKGTIDSFPLTNGALVFKGSSPKTITHVGIYCDDGFVYEAKGHKWGVVKTPFYKVNWQFWSLCPYIDYLSSASTDIQTTDKKSNDDIAREVIQGKWGNGQDRYNRLTQAGYDYKAVQAIVNKLLR